MNRKSAGEGGGLTGNAANPKKRFRSQEKTSISGKHNSGVTSGKKQEKRLIGKQATLLDRQPDAKES